MRPIVALSLLPLLGPWTPAAAQSQGIVISGTADNRPILCRPVQSVTLSKANGVLTLDANCGGAAVLHCQPTSFSHTGYAVQTDCKSITPAAPFKVAHLPAMTTINPGSTAPLLVQVYNNTGKALASVTITASAAPGCTSSRTNVAVGAVISYTCYSPAATADLVDDLVVTATAADNSVYRGTARSIVMVDGPRLGVLAQDRYQIVNPAAPAAWSVRVRNMGPTDQSSLIVADQRFDSNCSRTLGTLPAASWIGYACSVPSVTSSFTDRFSASAYGPQALVSDAFATVVTSNEALFHDGFEPR